MEKIEQIMGRESWDQNHRCRLLEPTFKFTFK